MWYTTFCAIAASCFGSWNCQPVENVLHSVGNWHYNMALAILPLLYTQTQTDLTRRHHASAVNTLWILQHVEWNNFIRCRINKMFNSMKTLNAICFRELILLYYNCSPFNSNEIVTLCFWALQHLTRLCFCITNMISILHSYAVDSDGITFVNSHEAIKWLFRSSNMIDLIYKGNIS